MARRKRAEKVDPTSMAAPVMRRLTPARIVEQLVDGQEEAQQGDLFAHEVESPNQGGVPPIAAAGALATIAALAEGEGAAKPDDQGGGGEGEGAAVVGIGGVPVLCAWCLDGVRGGDPIKTQITDAAQLYVGPSAEPVCAACHDLVERPDDWKRPDLVAEPGPTTCPRCAETASTGDGVRFVCDGPTCGWTGVLVPAPAEALEPPPIDETVTATSSPTLTARQAADAATAEATLVPAPPDTSPEPGGPFDFDGDEPRPVVIETHPTVVRECEHEPLRKRKSAKGWPRVCPNCREEVRQDGTIVAKAADDLAAAQRAEAGAA